MFLPILHFNLCWPSLTPSKFIVLKDTYVNTCLKYTGETQSHTVVLYMIYCTNEDKQESISFINKILRGVSQMYVRYKTCPSNKKKEKAFLFSSSLYILTHSDTLE